ncbi:MAG TPA: PilT/PilU family type 4a pilus ATPase [Pyrinomonadaceae bacterium]|nr:PilT/PilU family type 4a pilus ATPase [Pyrinomonadaceae bacterium]
MEKLNDYLQRLLSSCSDELRLEPDKNPYLVSENSTTDVANVPLMGTQISTMVFPLIPPGVKTTLPHRSEVEFVLPHSLGNFNFNVQKSSSGFVVTIRPVLTDSNGSIDVPRPPSEIPPSIEREDFVPPTTPAPTEEFTFSAEPVSALSYDLESSSFGLDETASTEVETASFSDVIFEDEKPAEEYVPSSGPELEIVSFNDPAYQTIFSDTATYEPPGRRDDFITTDYVPSVETSFPVEEYSPEPTGSPSSSAGISTPLGWDETPAEAAFVPTLPNASEALKMDDLFRKMAELGASDLHLSVSMPPMVRKDGKIQELEPGSAKFTPETMRELLTSIMPPNNQEEFARRNDTDFAYEVPGLARFRCNIFMDRKGMGAVFRIIPSKILTAEQLGLSKAIMDLCNLSKGLVVVTGPTGSGKSTTLCAMVDSINKNREDHIITIEDPIEFTHENHRCLVNQREVHNHTDSFKDALRAALREDPDILLVGEMRDLETISIAIETAETGHLVFGTLHTTTAMSTIDRIIDQFPADRQEQIRVMLSESLKGVIAQTLLPKIGGGRVAALEILIITPAISNLIREGKTFQIASAMQTGKNHGMVMLNDALFEHVKNGLVTPMDAYVKAVDKSGFEALLTRNGFKL